jgi:L-iditol 2-dehydrogenase
MMLELSRVYGASRVFAAQRSKKRLELARPFLPNARFICTEEEDLVDTVLQETDGEGVDCVVTTAGTVKAHEDAIHMVRHRGYVNLFGGLKNEPQLCIDSNLIHYKECFVMGSHGSLPRHHRMAVQLIEQGAVQAEKYISRIFPLERIEEAFAYHESRQGLKVVVKPGGIQPGVDVGSG